MWKRVIAVVAILLLATTGCSPRLTQLFKKPPAVSNLPPSALFSDGPAIHTRTLNLIDSAQKSLYVEQVLFDDSELMNHVIKKFQAGVEVKILLDQWQSPNKTTLDSLKSQGISVQFYPARKGQFHRVKFLVVDQTKALVYGPSWTSSSWQANHDLAVELSGRSAGWTADIFAQDWKFTTTLSLDVSKSSALPDDYIVLARNANLKQQISERIMASNQSIWVETAEVSDEDTIQSLIDAAGKGRDVRLLLSQKMGKDKPDMIARLKTGGVKIRYATLPNNEAFNLHIGLFDDKTFILTSSDWSYYTFVINHEFSITVPSPTATAKLKSVFEADWATGSAA